ncbi:helix-turn-helix domain-containing protein [Dialister micraerophilus]|uniref:helix-turn-helix domain-containing protein n=1 Tax=Dialister micraerophilus TaxID=309120 RepID=UPI0023F00E04|nr:helix-turn-helix transcriptional regulator [Dialister micraerophilus]
MNAEKLQQISLKAARVNAGLIIRKAAEEIGIGKDTLIKWEKEPWKVNALYQAKISKVYKMPINQINFLPKN